MNIEEANEIIADACGIDPDIYGCHVDEDYSDYSNPVEWTITDPRCREVIRNWWLNQDKRRAVSFTDNECWYFVMANFATLDEISARCSDEVNCILAICEELKE